jgi:hypothetical protein
MNPKILALYLPQYHETDYNSVWWGDGYTEWTACRAAKPLFKKHYQPRIPIDKNYYDLSKVESIKNQANMAKQYGIYGFVVYQYYSCNGCDYGKRIGNQGSLLLNVPTELLRDHHEIDIPYCLCWANHDWRKNWFGYDSQMLWQQEYGDENDWREYFEYNLTFFKDERYLKISNKPVFFIFTVWHFKQIKQFMECWNKWARENGFDGIYFVKTSDAHAGDDLDGFDATYRREPFYTFAKGFTKANFIWRVLRTRTTRYINKLLKNTGKGIISYTCNYDRLWKRIVARDDIGSHIIPGVIADWDNSARKLYDAQLLTGVTPKKFGFYFKKLFDKCRAKDVPFIVINAWNEWAEGAYLEPDEKYKYEYLLAIKSAKKFEG